MLTQIEIGTLKWSAAKMQNLKYVAQWLGGKLHKIKLEARTLWRPAIQWENLQ